MLGYLFIDMNAYFASVEQELRPELCGKAIGVVPMLTETTCCIAASYEAKKYGVKTGTSVADARRLCPGIRLIEARPEEYVRMHHRVVAAVNSCLPVETVMSVDEMMCKLIGIHRREETAANLARQIKTAIKQQCGEQMRASVGIAPNRTLAKMAADMQKPDGLTLVRAEDLPQRLYELKLTDFPGVGERMQARLHGYGVTTVEQFCQMPVEQLSRVWGSKLLGRIWWYRLRGEDLPEVATQRRSVGHSHVLPPAIREEESALGVLVCMTHKAAARMRRIGYWAQSVHVSVSFFRGGSWHQRRRIPAACDTHTLVQEVTTMWHTKPADMVPLKVGVVLGDLVKAGSATRSLFDENEQLEDVSLAMDRINEKLGDHAIYLGGMFGAQPHDPLRIAFTRIPDTRRMHEAGHARDIRKMGNPGSNRPKPQQVEYEKQAGQPIMPRKPPKSEEQKMNLPLRKWS